MVVDIARDGGGGWELGTEERPGKVREGGGGFCLCLATSPQRRSPCMAHKIGKLRRDGREGEAVS